MNPAFEALAGRAMLTKSGVKSGKMFGHRSLTVRDKAFCVEYEEDVVFKLDGDDHADALAIPGALPWDPSGKNRPMKEWVQLPAGLDQPTYEQFMLAAYAYVSLLGG